MDLGGVLFSIYSLLTELSAGFQVSFPHSASDLLEGDIHVQYIVECESECGNWTTSGSPELPPRYSVYSKSIYMCPLNVAFNDLIPADASRMVLPEQFRFVHNYIVSIDESTNFEGWQYRSRWPGAANEINRTESWSRTPPAHSTNFVRRRLWIRTIGSTDKLSIIRDRISKYARSCVPGVLFHDNVEILDSRSGEWKSKEIIATIFELKSVNDFCEDTEYVLPSICRVRPVSGRSRVYSVEEEQVPNSHMYIRFSQTTWQRQAFLFPFHLALLSRDFSFSCLPFSPPFHIYSERVKFSGSMYKLGLEKRSWKSRYFELTPSALRYYRGCEMRGYIDIPGSKIIVDEYNPGSSRQWQNSVFTVQTSTGFDLTIRNASIEQRDAWIAAIAEEINGWPRDVDSPSSNLPLFSLSETFDSESYDTDILILSNYVQSPNPKLVEYSFDRDLYGKNRTRQESEKFIRDNNKSYSIMPRRLYKNNDVDESESQAATSYGSVRSIISLGCSEKGYDTDRSSETEASLVRRKRNTTSEKSVRTDSEDLSSESTKYFDRLESLDTSSNRDIAQESFSSISQSYYQITNNLSTLAEKSLQLRHELIVSRQNETQNVASSVKKEKNVGKNRSKDSFVKEYSYFDTLAIVFAVLFASIVGLSLVQNFSEL